MRSMRGFTLIELIITISILSIISLIVGQVMWNGFNVYLHDRQNLNFAENAQTVFARINRDLNTAQSVQAAATDQFSFVDSNGNAISYTLNGATLMRNNQPLADHVSQLSFSYFDNNGAVTAALNQIFYITIFITFTQNNTNFNIQTTIYPRNL